MSGRVVEVPMLLVERPERTWRVVCVDNVVRHEGTFESLADARTWADTGHACLCIHTYHEVWS